MSVMRVATCLSFLVVGCNGILGQVDARPSIATTAACHVWIAQGSQADVPFIVNRTRLGPLTVRATSLPEGVTASDVVLGSGESSGTLTLTASSASVLGATSSVGIQLLEGAQVDDEASVSVGVSGAPGTLDATWGSGGLVKLPPLLDPTSGYVVDVDSQGRIVIAGTMVISDSDVRLVIARYNVDGSLDDSFGDHPAGTRLGYTVFNPGWSANSAFSTTPVGIRVDSQDRIVVANTRGGGHCYAEVGRWTDSGDVDKAFKRFSTFELNGTQFCGAASDLTLQPDGQIVLLAYWNFHDGMESIVQILDGSDGSPTGTYHVVLDGSGTLTHQHMTQMFAVASDDRGGFVISGEQYSGTNWTAGARSQVNGVIARVGDDGQLDTSFGTRPGYTSYGPAYTSSFAPTFTDVLYDVAIDPTSKDIVGVGETIAAMSSMVRLDGQTGQPTGFGQMIVDVCPGGTGQALTQVMFDCRSRIVTTGTCGKDGVGHVASTRMSNDGVVDQAYGTAGVALSDGSGRGAKLGADGRLYVVGEIDSRAAIWRFWQ